MEERHVEVMVCGGVYVEVRVWRRGCGGDGVWRCECVKVWVWRCRGAGWDLGGLRYNHTVDGLCAHLSCLS